MEAPIPVLVFARYEDDLAKRRLEARVCFAHHQPITILYRGAESLHRMARCPHGEIAISLEFAGQANDLFYWLTAR
jgi:hypothetical protein